MMKGHRLSIVIPALNEAETIAANLSVLQPLRRHGAEIIVVDGGSSDDTVQLSSSLADQVLVAPRGRASQMNAGARRAGADRLLFLHSDTCLPPGAMTAIDEALRVRDRAWGRFDVSITPSSWAFQAIAFMMNFRSRLTGVATGDQAIFVTRAAFEHVGGFPDLPLMEDIAISRSLMRVGRPACLRLKVMTSGRRWEKHGVIRTMFLMWRLRLAFYLGARPSELARRYGYAPRPD